MTLFSVIIPTFNRRDLLINALASVQRQTFHDTEIIVIDDGSTDGTVDYVRQRFHDVVILVQANRGPSAARNNGARAANGRYLAFLDSDDLWFPWTLAVADDAIRRHNSPAVISLSICHFSDARDVDAIPQLPMNCEYSKCWFDALSNRDCYVGAGAMIVDREAFLKCGGFSETIGHCEDHDLMLRLGNSSGFAEITTPKMIAWRRHGGSTTNDLSRTIHGMSFLLDQEGRRVYPGGEYRNARTAFLGARVRPVSLQCLDQGKWKDGWRFYWRTLAMNLSHYKWRYAAGFPLYCLARWFQHRFRRWQGNSTVASPSDV